MLGCFGTLHQGALVSAQANAEPGTEFSAASEAFAQGDYVRALALFEAAREAGRDGPAVYYNIGVCQYKLGEYDDAEATFRLIAERFAEMHDLAQYNVGLSLVGQGREDEARRAFERAVASRDPTIVGLSQAMLQRLEGVSPGPSRARWTGLVDLGIGHDDNVALIEEASLPAGESTDSVLHELFAFASGTVAERVPLRLDVSGYSVRYPDAGQFDQDAWRVGGTFQWRVGNWQVEAGPHYNHTRLDSDGFERQLGVSMRLVRPLNSSLSVELRAGHDEIEELEERFDFVDGTRDRLRAGLQVRYPNGRLRASYERERNDRLGPTVSPDRHRWSVDYVRRVDALWSLDLEAVYRDSRYSELEEPRDERLFEIIAGAQRELPAGWSLNMEVRSADNDASDDFFTYERQRVLLGVSKIF